MLKSVRTKFIGQAVFSVALVAGLGLAGLFASKVMSGAITELNDNAVAIRSQMNADMLHDTLRGDVYESLLASNDTQHKQQLITETGEHAAELTKTLDELAQMNLNPKISETLKSVRQPVQQYINTTQAIVKAASTSHEDAAAMLPQFTTSFELLEKELEALGDQIQSHIQSESTHAVALGAQVRTFTSIGIGVGALISATLAGLLARSVIRPILQMSREIHTIQQSHDLTTSIKVHSQDEIGTLAAAFNDMLGSLRTLVVQVKQGATVIDSGGHAISSASQTLAQGASEQASNLQQISASLELISSQTQQSASHVHQASTLAGESKHSADRGFTEMKEMTRAVNEIKQSSSEISNVIKVIDEIAFQTNLLALNAAVEAARAGEAGKGFAVVAEEVRNLAQRSAEAAKNTASMIDLSVKRSVNGVEIAHRVGKALEDITTSTNKVDTLLTELAASSTEQASGISQINQGLSQLDLVIQQNAGNSEELASSAEELSSQVVSLNHLVSHFRVEDGVLSTPSPAKKSNTASKSSRTAHRQNATELNSHTQGGLATF